MYVLLTENFIIEDQLRDLFTQEGFEFEEEPQLKELGNYFSISFIVKIAGRQYALNISPTAPMLGTMSPVSSFCHYYKEGYGIDLIPVYVYFHRNKPRWYQKARKKYWTEVILTFAEKCGVILCEINDLKKTKELFSEQFLL